MDDIIEIKINKVESSNVSGLGYDDNSETMALEMINGNLFYYLDIPKIHYEEMIKCNKEQVGISSIGSYLHRNIKGNYRYTRIN